MYRYRTVRTRTELNESKLNEFGRRGYELVGIIDDEFGYTYYFKIDTDGQA